MNPAILRSLLWKEWREVQWKAAALLSIALSLFATCMAVEWRDWSAGGARINLSEWVAAIAPALLVFLPAGGVFLGMWVAAGERDRGTATLWRGLPVRAPALLSAKLAAGIVACLLPLALVGLLSGITYLTQYGKPYLPSVRLMHSSWPLMVTGLTVSTFLWTVAVGIRQPTQVRAGVAGLAALAVWGGVILLASIGSAMYMRHYGWSPTNHARAEALVVIPMLFSPFGYCALMIQPQWLPGPWLMVLTIGIQVLTWVGLVAWARRGYHEVEAPERGGDLTATAAVRFVPIPVRYSRTGAVIWFQWRRIRPVAILCVVIVVGLVLLLTLGWQDWGSGFHEALVDISVLVGSVVAVLMGVGTFGLDGQKRLERFWRSRAISPALWFWLRYLTGAGVLLLGMHGATFLAFSATGGWFVAARGQAVGMLIGSPLVDLFVYSAAVALVCLLRQPVYAGILAVATGAAVWTGGGLVAIVWSEQPLWHPLWLAFCRGFSLFYVAEMLDHGPGRAALWALGQFFVTMTIATAAAACVGYVAIKRDIQLAGG